MITARDVMRRALRLNSDPHRDLTEEDESLDDLNQALHDISTLSESIVYGQYHRARNGESRYGLPENFLQVHFVGFRPLGGRFYPLNPTGIKKATVINQNQSTGVTPYFYPRYYDISGRSSREKLVAEVTTVHTEFSFEIGALPPEIKIGDPVINVSNAQAESNIAYIDDDIIFVDPWKGQASPGITLGNQIRILSTDTALQTLVISPAPTFNDEIGDESIYIYCAVYHRQITGIDVAAENDILDIDPELESALIFLTAHYIAIAEHGVASAEAQLFEAKYEREFHKNMPSINSRIQEFKSLWFDDAYAPYRREIVLTGSTSQTENSQNMVNR